MPDFPNQTSMPQRPTQMLNVCPIQPMHIIVRLLHGCQSSILSSNESHNDMKPAFISAVMAPNLKIKEITWGTRQSIPIPNQNICEGKINMATSPLPSWVPHGGERSIWLHCPCLLGFPMVRRKEGWKMGKNGWQFKHATSKMHKNLKKKTPGMEQKICGKGHSPYPQPERGHAKSVDYGSVSKVAQKYARHAAAPPSASAV